MDGTRVPAAYIFHGRDLNATDLPQRYPHQLMVMMLFEAPPYSGTSLFEVQINKYLGKYGTLSKENNASFT